MRPGDFDSLEPADVGELVRTKRERDKQIAMREDFRFGMICATLANLKRDPKKQPVPFQPKMFFASLAPPQRQMTSDEILQALGRMVGRPPPSKSAAASAPPGQVEPI